MSLLKEINNKTEEIETIDLRKVRCMRCNRILKSIKSISVGMGRICAEKDAYEKYQVAHPKNKKIFLTNKQQNNVLRFVKNYIQPRKVSLLETTNDTFNYIWGLSRGSSWYEGNTSFYRKHEIKNIEALLKIDI